MCQECFQPRPQYNSQEKFSSQAIKLLFTSSGVIKSCKITTKNVFLHVSWIKLWFSRPKKKKVFSICYEQKLVWLKNFMVKLFWFHYWNGWGHIRQYLYDQVYLKVNKLYTLSRNHTFFDPYDVCFKTKVTCWKHTITECYVYTVKHTNTFDMSCFETFQKDCLKKIRHFTEVFDIFFISHIVTNSTKNGILNIAHSVVGSC